MTVSTPPPEFSRPIALDRIESAEREHKIEASADERARLAKRFGLLGLKRLVADVHLRRIGLGPLIALRAELNAIVVQECVVTLQPFTQTLHDAFELQYLTGVDAKSLESWDEAGDSDILDPAAATVEPVAGSTIDIGEAVAQQLALALDPHPRSPQAAAGAAPSAGGGRSTSGSPFAVLAALKPKPRRSRR